MPGLITTSPQNLILPKLYQHDWKIMKPMKWLLPVPEKEWREPSVAQFKDQFGNPGVQTRFRLVAKTGAGRVVWVGWFDSRYEIDAFTWAIARNNLFYEKELWRLPDPHWHPDLVEGYITYDFSTVTFLTTTGSNQTFTSPSDWSNSTDGTNLVECIGGGAGGACQSGTAAHSTGGGGGSYSKIPNFFFVTPGTTTATYNIGTGGIAISFTGSNNSAGNNGSATWFNNASDPGVGADTSKCSAAPGTGGTTGAGSHNGGVGGATTSSWGTTKNAGGRGGNMTGGLGSGASGGGGAAGGSGVGGDGVDTAATSTTLTTNGGTSDNGALAGGGGATNGNPGTEWDGTHGSGSGGGGGAFLSAGGTAGSGGNYGGGGGGGEKSATGGTVTSGAGKQGIVVITYVPLVTTTTTQKALTTLSTSQFSRQTQTGWHRSLASPEAANIFKTPNKFQIFSSSETFTLPRQTRKIQLVTSNISPSIKKIFSGIKTTATALTARFLKGVNKPPLFASPNALTRSVRLAHSKIILTTNAAIISLIKTIAKFVLMVSDYFFRTNKSIIHLISFTLAQVLRLVKASVKVFQTGIGNLITYAKVKASAFFQICATTISERLFFLNVTSKYLTNLFYIPQVISQKNAISRLTTFMSGVSSEIYKLISRLIRTNNSQLSFIGIAFLKALMTSTGNILRYIRRINSSQSFSHDNTLSLFHSGINKFIVTANGALTTIEVAVTKTIAVLSNNTLKFVKSMEKILSFITDNILGFIKNPQISFLNILDNILTFTKGSRKNLNYTTPSQVTSLHIITKFINIVSSTFFDLISSIQKMFSLEQGIDPNVYKGVNKSFRTTNSNIMRFLNSVGKLLIVPVSSLIRYIRSLVHYISIFSPEVFRPTNKKLAINNLQFTSPNIISKGFAINHIIGILISNILSLFHGSKKLITASIGNTLRRTIPIITNRMLSISSSNTSRVLRQTFKLIQSGISQSLIRIAGFINIFLFFSTRNKLSRQRMFSKIFNFKTNFWARLFTKAKKGIQVEYFVRRKEIGLPPINVRERPDL